MKYVITSLFLLCLISIATAQELQFEIRGTYTRGVSKEKLHAAKTMIDIRPGYPASMIEGYTSTKISVITSGNSREATGMNETLNPVQQNLLKTAEVGSDIVVQIGYIHVNPVTLFPDMREMHFVLTVVPEVEAAYPGGYQELSTYLKYHAINKLPEAITKKMPPVLIRFVISDDGSIVNARITESSKDAAIDKLLLEAIRKMPKWNPAMSAEGERIEQEFEFSVGNTGC